jgi:GNAT superfamily N-acetyltransferase
MEIKEILIAEHKAEISLLMSELQLSEQSLFNKSAQWNEIEQNYINHLISMQQECEGTCFVTYIDKEPIGFIFGYVEEEDESRIEISFGKELYISDGYVKPLYRKQGIYKRMNALIEHKYVEKGVRRITRFTLVNNEPMKNFLTGAGYSATRILFEKWL